MKQTIELSNWQPPSANTSNFSCCRQGIMKLVQCKLLLVALTAQAAVAEHMFGVSDLSDAMGSPVGRASSKDRDNVGVADLEQFFEPQVGSVPVRQERPEDSDTMAHSVGFEAFDAEIDCGDHGCAEPVDVELVTVVSPGGQGERSQTTGELACE
jgi:hypothetical protein